MNNKKRITTTEYLILLLVMTDILLGFAVLATKNGYISSAFSALVFISGAWLLVATFKSIRVSLVSSQWIRVPYEVIETRFSWQMPGGGRNSKFIPYFKVRYKFYGITYTRSSDDDLNLSLIPIFGSNKAAHEYLDAVRNFQYGTDLFVNPDKPQIAFLRTGIGRDQYGRLIFSLMLIVLPVLTYAELIKWRY